MNNKLLGRSGENMAANYLIAKGHEIMEQGFRAKTGEIDLISFDREKDEIHFVEVKTRTGTGYGLPRESVTRDKLRHIQNTAEVYIKQLENTEKNYSGVIPKHNYSIDVIEVLINHLEGVE